LDAIFNADAIGTAVWLREEMIILLFITT
jgi:hypothetical protein